MENCVFGPRGGTFDHASSSYGAGTFPVSTKFDQYPSAGCMGPSGNSLPPGIGGHQGPYAGIVRDGYTWDRVLNENDCDYVTRSTPFGSQQMPYVVTRGEGMVEERGGGRGGGGGECGGVSLTEHSVDLRLVDAAAAESVCDSHLPVAMPTTSSHLGYLLDWKDSTSCHQNFYAGGNSGYSDFSEPGQRPIHAACSLSQSELYECPPLASTYPNAFVSYICQGQGSTEAAKQFCQSPRMRSRDAVEEWRSGSVDSDDLADETTTTTTTLRGAFPAAESSSLPGDSTGANSRVQIPRVHSTSSSFPPLPRKNLSGSSSSLHSPRKRPSSLHEQRSSADLPLAFLDETEKKIWERDRRKKDNHNLIERRRRLNINDKIKELGTLIPNSILSIPKDSLHDKGSILRTSVDYIQQLQHELRRLQHAEQRTKELVASNRQMKQRLKDLENFVKSAGLFDKYQSSSGVPYQLYDRSPDKYVKGTSSSVDAVKEETI